MSSTPSKPTGEAAQSSAVFSYAQAAKGRAAAAAASATQSTQSNASGISTPSMDTSAINTPSVGSERGDKSVNGSTEVTNRSIPPAEIATPEWRIAAPSKPTSIPASPSVGTASTSTLPKEDKDDDFIMVGTPADRGAQADNGRPFEAVEGRRKKTKKQKSAEKEVEKEKEKEKEREEVKPEILVPAPLPTVNFWQQRSQESAKAKPTPVVGQSSADPALGDAPSSKDSKKRSKASNTEDGDKTNGVTKTATSPTGKGQRKSADGVNKPKDEQTGKRLASRGSRVENDEKDSNNQLPPPVDDSMSWPTPETALEEEKRKTQEKLERDEKDDTTSNKQPRQKEKWVPVPYVPSVNFNTPIPTRGGRGRGGARGGRTEAGGRSNGDKTPNGMTASGTLEPERQNSKGDSRSSSLPPAKRHSSDQTDSRKPFNAQTGEKTKGSQREHSHVQDVRTTLGSDQMLEGNQEQRDTSRGFKSEQAARGSEPYVQSRSNGDRSSEPNLRGSEHSKENGAFGKEGSHRGRGGYRGRGNHAGFPNGQAHPQHAYTNGHAPQQSNGYTARQNSGPYSPPVGQPFSNQYMPAPSRGRGGARSHSIPNGGMHGSRFMQNGQVPPYMGPLQTTGQGFDYHQPMQSMNATPYNPYVESVTVVALVTMQIEYYFSIDNLCKDVFLRKHMDGQGFVFLTFIAGFKRIQALTHDFDLLRYACQESAILELVRGSDGADRLRRKEGWEKWVLVEEERDESVRNNGPESFSHPSPVASRLQHMMPGQSMSPTSFPSNGAENFRPYTNGASMPTSQANGFGDNYHSDTPLSAAVPDFAPAQPYLNGAPDSLEAENNFNDNEVLNLTLVFLPKSNDDGSQPKSPFTNPRTFSNGSIDGRSIAQELSSDPSQGRPLTNGSPIQE